MSTRKARGSRVSSRMQDPPIQPPSNTSGTLDNWVTSSSSSHLAPNSGQSVRRCIGTRLPQCQSCSELLKILCALQLCMLKLRLRKNALQFLFQTPILKSVFFSFSLSLFILEKKIQILSTCTWDEEERQRFRSFESEVNFSSVIKNTNDSPA